MKFELTIGSRSYRFTDPVNESEFWVEKIVYAILLANEREKLRGQENSIDTLRLKALARGRGKSQND